MRFSEAFKVVRGQGDDWFDPHLTVDTRLFIDPLLLLDGGVEWKAAHKELISHFVHCYGLIAKSTGQSSVSAKVAVKLLTFPEPSEIGLGYTLDGTSGSGSGAKFAKQMVDGISVAIAAGLENPEHVEEIGILNEGIGADRISDAAANVLKHRFISYTQEVAARHKLKLDSHRVKNTRCNLKVGRWVTEFVDLPTNPETGKPIVLVPEHLLNDLPVLNADDWYDSGINDDIRNQINLSVGARARKKDIVELARRNPDHVRAWAREQTSRPDLQGYDFSDDPKGVVQWDAAPVDFARASPIVLDPVVTQDDLSALVERLLDQYRHFIEDQRGWSLLWDAKGKEKNELAAQLVFFGMAQHYLRLFDVEVDREVELGRGPVDFKASSGASLRLLIEIKKEHNGKFWNGVEKQLPSYLVSDDAIEGWFVAIRYRDNLASEKRMMALPIRVRRIASRAQKTIKYKSIDARPRESASNIPLDKNDEAD